MAANTSQIGFIACSSTNITQSAYVQINFGTESANPASYPFTPVSTSKLQITDTTGKLIKIATGPAGSQTDIYTVAPNASILINLYLPPGTAIWAEALDSSNVASSGYVAVSLVP